MMSRKQSPGDTVASRRRSTRILVVCAVMGMAGLAAARDEDLRFRRGDANGDSILDLSDPIATLEFLFGGGAEPGCNDAADTNDSGEVDLSDAAYALGFLFLGGPAPPAPGPSTCGWDPTRDALSCAVSDACDEPALASVVEATPEYEKPLPPVEELPRTVPDAFALHSVEPLALVDPSCEPVFEDINPDQSDLDTNGTANGSSGGRFNGLAGVAGDNETFYGASEWGGMYKSTDGGLEWERLTGHMPTACWDVEVDPVTTTTVYGTSFFDGRVTALSGINVSYDAGSTWVHPATAQPNAPADEGTASDNTPQAGYSCSNSRRIEPSAFGISIRPDAPANVAIGTNCGLALSTDSGVTWSFVDPFLPMPPPPAPPPVGDVWDVVYQGGGPTGQGIIDVVGDGGHSRSTDGGMTWSPNNLPIAARSIAVSPDENYVLFAAGFDIMLYESDDGGANWTNLGRMEPRRRTGGGRIPFVAANDRTNGFEVWTGGVSLYRVACTTPAVPGVGGPPRCSAGVVVPPPMGPIPLPAGWFGGFTTRAGAHDDVGDIIFDTEAANDAAPLIFSSDGGVYYAMSTCAGPTTVDNDLDGQHDEDPLDGNDNDQDGAVDEDPYEACLLWEQPDKTPHALWLFGMAGVDQPGDASEGLYFGCQDNGVFATTNASDDPKPDWHSPLCCDSFDLAADDDTVLYNQGFISPRDVPWRLGSPGLPGFNPPQFNAADYPPTGLATEFRFAESIDVWGDDRYVMLMRDCNTASPIGNRDQGCPGGMSDGGLFITTDIKASPISWTELGEPEPFNSALFADVEAALDAGGTPTFYVGVGGGNRLSAEQLWKFVGTNQADTYTRIDTNIPGASGVSVWTVDPNDPDSLYAAAIIPGGNPQMVFSTDGGMTWDNDVELDNLMQGGGVFSYVTQRGPTNFTGFGGYPQPSLLAFDPEDPNIMVAGGRDSGVFISRNRGRRWGLLTDPFDSANTGIPHLPRPFFAHFDHEPEDSNLLKLFIGTQGFGVWRITVPIDVPVISIPDGIDFGEVCLGSTGRGTLYVCNTGSGCNDLIVEDIASSDPQFRVVEPSSGFPIVISPDFCFPFQVRFTPTAMGPQSALLTVSSNDPEQPAVDVEATGVGTVPDIRVTGSADFGTVCPGELAEKTVWICNVGACDLEVTSVAFDPPCPDFTLVNSPFPATVSPDFCLPFVVRFTPTSAGPKVCTLVIESNDPDDDEISVEVTAETPFASIDVPPDLAFPPTVIRSLGPCKTALPFPISNTGECNLTITSIEITDNSDEYSLSGLPSFPIILQPGHVAGDGDLRLVFTPGEVGRSRTGEVTVTYVSDPVTPVETMVTRALCGEGVKTGARVLATSAGTPLQEIESIMLLRINANRNRTAAELDTVDVMQDVALQAVNPPAPCEPFSFHREYGTVSNPIQLLPGFYQVSVTAKVGGRRVTKMVGFNVDTCDFNQDIVIDVNP